MPESDDAVLRRALSRWRQVVDAEHDQRERELSDLRFDAGEQWDAAVIKARSASVIGNMAVPARPMLTIPKLDQPVQLQINQQKAAHLGIHVHPETDDATDDTAEVIQGLIRQIEVKSRAHLARDWAFERAVKCGRGWWRIDKVPCDEYASRSGPEAFDQDLRIRRILNQASVYVDPSCVEPDCSDMQWAFVVEDVSVHEHRQRWKDAALSRADQTFTSIGDAPPGWITGSGDEAMIRVAEYWEVVTRTTSRIAYKDRDGATQYADDTLPAGVADDAVLNRRDVPNRTVIWRTLNATEILDGPTEWDGKYIPLVPMIGRELNINGDRQFLGIIRPSKDGQRLFNYAVSTAVEAAALAPKAQWVIAEGQDEGHEQEFALAHVRNFYAVHYKPTSLGDQLVPPPQRNVVSTDLSTSLALAQIADESIKATTFVYDPSLGNLPTKDRSGKAIMALQQQADAGNSHYLDNLVSISMPHEARMLLDLIPKVYDRPGRIVRVIDAEETASQVMLGQPHVVDPQTQRPRAVQIPPGMHPQDVSQDPRTPVKHYDLQQGMYGVTVSVGKSYQTARQQGADALGSMLQALPNLFPVLGWRWAQSADWPGHQEVADDLKKLRPPQLQQGDGQNDPSAQLSQLQQQLGAMSQQHELLVKELNARTDALKTEQAKYSYQFQVKQLEFAQQEKLARLKAETDLAIAEMKARADTALQVFQAEQERAGLGADRTHEAIQAHADRAHEMALSAADAAHQQQLAQQQHEAALEQQAQSAANPPQGGNGGV